LRGLEPHLLRRVIGQDDAVRRVCRALEAAELGLNETGPRPKGSFLFMGPTGVGKTSLTKAFSEYLFGSTNLTMLFCNQLQAEADAGELVAAVKRAVEAHPEGTTLLFDEVEKAHRAVIDVFLSLIDEGQAALPGGARVSIRGCYVVMTSNLGTAKFAEMHDTLYATMQAFAYDQARKALRPEMFARLTEVIVFRPLSQQTQVSILSGLLADKLQHLQGRFGELLGLGGPLSVEPKGVHAHLLRKGFTQTAGARRLREELNRQLNEACLPWLLKGLKPSEGRFYANHQQDCLELR
jgi:ATP-dependent Clp protease ATP-binding subunit ClpA